jgi:hypothetical protein
MTEGTGAKDAPHPPSDEERASGPDLFGLGEQDRRALLDWVGGHLPQVRRSVYDQRLLHWSLGIGFVVGLAAHVGGYLLKAWVTTEPLGLVADLLYALGFALWTGVVVVLFVQVPGRLAHFRSEGRPSILPRKSQPLREEADDGWQAGCTGGPSLR